MLNTMSKCRKMLKNVKRCRKVSKRPKNLKSCRKMSNYVEVLPKNVESCLSHVEKFQNVEICLKVLKNTETSKKFAIMQKMSIYMRKSCR